MGEDVFDGERLGGLDRAGWNDEACGSMCAPSVIDWNKGDFPVEKKCSVFADGSTARSCLTRFVSPQSLTASCLWMVSVFGMFCRKRGDVSKEKVGAADA